MVLALLHESDLILSDDVIETIVVKVQITQPYQLCSFMIIWPKISEFLCPFHRASVMLIQMVMEKLTQKSGKSL